MKIIFLDIDGVLNVIPQGHDKYGAKFHKHFEDNLKHIIEKTGAKIVISSTWRFGGLQEMKDMWKDRNLSGEIIGITPYTLEYRKRGEEIKEWLDNNPTEKYVIIDDDTDMLPEQKNNFVKTSDNINHTGYIDVGYGLTKECAEQAISILNLE